MQPCFLAERRGGYGATDRLGYGQAGNRRRLLVRPSRYGRLFRTATESRRAFAPRSASAQHAGKKRQRATKLQLRCEKRSSATQPKPVSALLLCSNFPKAGMWSTKELWRWP